MGVLNGGVDLLRRGVRPFSEQFTHTIAKVPDGALERLEFGVTHRLLSPVGS
jgi:hypothetical protein